MVDVRGDVYGRHKIFYKLNINIAIGKNKKYTIFLLTWLISREKNEYVIKSIKSDVKIDYVHWSQHRAQRQCTGIWQAVP